jgi:hypothetical protein
MQNSATTKKKTAPFGLYEKKKKKKMSLWPI